MGMPPVSNAEVNSDEHHIDEHPKKCQHPHWHIRGCSIPKGGEMIARYKSATKSSHPLTIQGRMPIIERVGSY